MTVPPGQVPLIPALPTGATGVLPALGDAPGGMKGSSKSTAWPFTEYMTY